MPFNDWASDDAEFAAAGERPVFERIAGWDLLVVREELVLGGIEEPSGGRSRQDFEQQKPQPADKEAEVDGVDAPSTASKCQSGDVEHHLQEASMEKVSIVGLDLANR
jgi:hypothetical protein